MIRLDLENSNHARVTRFDVAASRLRESDGMQADTARAEFERRLKREQQWVARIIALVVMLAVGFACFALAVFWARGAR